MKKALLLDGGVRHILLFIGLTYIAWTFAVLFKWVNPAESGEYWYREMVMFLSFVLGFLGACAAELYQDKGTKHEATFSWTDVLFYTLGAIIGGIEFIWIGATFISTVVALALVSFAYFDYKVAFIKNKFK